MSQIDGGQSDDVPTLRLASKQLAQSTAIGDTRGQGGDAPTCVLLVEDDDRIRYALGLALRDEGYEVHEARTGEQALQQLAVHSPDVVLLDLMLPGIDGITVCRRVRERGDLPVIMVTARAESRDVIRGLEAGADDYVTKPLVAQELAARIRALLRRVQPRQGARTIGDLELLPEEGVVRRHGETLHLTKTEFRLLCELAAHAGRVVTREELLERVWGYDYFGDTRLLDVHVRRLRVKVEDDAADPRLVLTVRGVGYKIDG